MSQITKTAEVKPIASTESYGRAIAAGLACDRRDPCRGLPAHPTDGRGPIRGDGSRIG